MARITPDTFKFLEAELVLQVSDHIDPAKWDEDRYDGFLDALCPDRPYQREAILTALRFLLGGEYPDLRALAKENFERSGSILPERYGSLDRMEAKLTFPDKLSGTIDLATGTGKSYVMYGIAAIMLAEGAVDRVLVLCPSNTIEIGLLEKFKALAGSNTLKLQEFLPSGAKVKIPGIIKGDESIKTGDICVENYHQILEASRSSIRDSLSGKGARTLVLNDETHHATNGTGADERKWTEFLGDAKFGFRYVVGLTGTAYSGNEYFSDVIFRYSLKSALEEKFVKRINYVVENAKVRDRTERWQVIHNHHSEAREKLKARGILPLTIVVCATTAKADNVADELRAFLREAEGWDEDTALKNVMCVHSKNPGEVARLKIVDQSYSTVEWIVSVAMLTEGWDVKRVFGIVPDEEKAFDSKLLIAQVLGRGLRIPEGWTGGEVPTATVWNHDAWANRIKHLVDSILEQERKLAARVRADSPFHFDLHSLEYEVTATKEMKPAPEEPMKAFKAGTIDLSSDAAREKVTVRTEGAGTGKQGQFQTEIVRSIYTAKEIAQTMFERLTEYNTIEYQYTDEWPLATLEKIVEDSLAKVGIVEPTENTKQQFLKAMGSLRRRAANMARMESSPGKWTTISTKTRRLENASASAIRGGSNKIVFWTEGSRDTLDLDEAAFFDEAVNSDGAFRLSEVRNRHHFRTPLGLVIAESEPERAFIRGLIDKDNATHLDAWIKSVSTGFYTVQFAWSKKGLPKKGNFNPDFFLKINDDLVCVVEIKDEKQVSEPSDENRAKYEFAASHFERINKHLTGEGSWRRYHFNFLTPDDFGIFFQYLRDGKLATFQSQLDVALKTQGS